MKTNKIQSPYGQTPALQFPIENVECWNKTGPERFTLPSGTLLKIEYASDSTRTTCMAQDPANPGKSLELFPGAYRWIVANVDLARATGVPFQSHTTDFVGDLIAYESGEASPAQVKRVLRTARKMPGLQGHYGRAAS